MSDRKADESKQKEAHPIDWMPIIHAILGTVTLMGAGIGGMLHFLNTGEGHPEYQMFVMRISAFVLILIFFFLILATMAMFAIESGKLDRKHTDRKYVKISIRGLTLVFMLLLGISAYGIILSGGKLLGDGMQEYISSLKSTDR